MQYLNYQLLTVVIVCLNLISCQQKTENGASFDAPLISVDLPQKHQIINFYGDFRRVDKWHVDQNYLYFISDKQLFVYNYDGELQFALLNDPRDENCVVVDVKSNNKEIFVLCRDKGMVNVINKSNWEVLRAMDIGVNGSAIEVSEQALFVYQTPNTLNLGDDAKNYQLSIFDLEGNLSNRLFPYEKSKENSFQFSVAVTQTFSKFKNTISFTRFMNDTVYYFNEKGDKISYDLLGFNSDPQDQITNQELMMQGHEMDIAFFPVYFTYNDQYAATLYLKSLQLNLGLHDRANNRSYNISVFEDQVTNARLMPAAKIYNGNLFLLVSDESVIGLNEEREINNKSMLGKNLNELKQYEKYQILLRIDLDDLQF